MDFATSINEGETVTVNRVKYVVEVLKTADSYIEEGNFFIADRMRRCGSVADLVLRRPRGAQRHLVAVAPREDEGWPLRYVMPF